MIYREDLLQLVDGQPPSVNLTIVARCCTGGGVKVVFSRESATASQAVALLCVACGKFVESIAVASKPTALPVPKPKAKPRQPPARTAKRSAAKRK